LIYHKIIWSQAIINTVRRSRAVVSQSNLLKFLLAVWAFAGLAGCRTTRPEVPPPPKFTTSGKKQPVGFGTAPRAGYMVDAANQTAPGISTPGQSQTSMANRNEYTNPNTNSTDNILLAEPAKGSAGSTDAGTSGFPKLGGIMKGLGNGSAGKSDAGVERVSTGSPAKPAQPIEPPISLPPPPILPPPAAVPPVDPSVSGSNSEHAPAPLPIN
jgi:hypothetical protein